MKFTPVLLLTGYLGSGKTTLVNNILRNCDGIRFAVIVNDIGEVNIDASLMEKGGVVTEADSSLVALQNGCICCSLQTDLMEQLRSIMASERFDYIVIEASGICEPEPIARTVCSFPAMGPEMCAHGIPRIDTIVTVVDALRLADEFDGGSALTAADVADNDIERLVANQIEFCNIVLLNKASSVDPARLASTREVVKALNPGADIIECDYSDVPLGRIIHTDLFSLPRVATQAAWVQGLDRQMTPEEEHRARHHHHHDHEHEHDHDHHHHHDGECSCHGECTCGHHHHNGEGHHHSHTDEYGIQTFVYYRRAPFDFDRFDRMLAQQWPREVIRCKGVVYFSNNTDMSVLFETVGRQKKITQAGLWYATAPAGDIAQLRAADPSFDRDWDPELGDRMIKLVLIYRNCSRQHLTDLLDSCLATNP